MFEHSHPALMPTYPRCELQAIRGEGAYLYDQNDRRYLDFAAGIAVNSLGHCHPHLVEALKAQSEKLWHCANLYRIPEGERLAQRLVDASFADKVFFTNSGVEALECAIKAARRWQHDSGHPEKHRIIGFLGAFHGRSTATIAAAGNPAYLKGFGQVAPGFDHVAFGNMNEVRNAVTPETAAILVEPVQGEGGLKAADPEFLKALRAVCDEFGLLLILDEVQCGAGRTGKLYAHEWAGITPDIVATAKGIGGGFPVGACLATEEVGRVMVPGTHGSTYGGNPLAMAVGNAVLDVLLADGFLDEVVRKSEILGGKLQDLVARHPKVWTELRGAGLMLGLQAVQPNREVMEKLRHAGLLTVAAGDNVLRLLPPLIIEEAQIDEALEILEGVSSEVAKAA